MSVQMPTVQIQPMAFPNPHPPNLLTLHCVKAKNISYYRDKNVCVFVYRNDIALLRLSTYATLNSYVKLATLPPANRVTSGTCTVTGWGRTSRKQAAILVIFGTS